MTMRLVGWAIIHSLWQGGVIALVTTGLLAAARQAKPVVRYAISLGALVMMVVLPIVSAAVSTSIPESDTASTSSSSFSLSQPAASSSPTQSSSPSSTVSNTSVVENLSIPTRSDPVVLPETVRHYGDLALPWLVTAWILGLFVSSARLIGGFAKTRKITRHATSGASRALVLRAEKLCERLGITRAIRLLESTAIDVPLVVGAIRPVIVVPASLITGLTPLQLDMLLAHELAHIRRHDYLINLLQTVLETLLFYHPAARWISDRAREERENCCDDIAVAVCGGDAGQYTS
ncbi:MAG TPA: M56 family metallopeptidase, partial [Gemmatimonadaceae bacterium]|nr:M56 family metallopeptidase [Gemmatimonadaceae bacterium]